MVFGIQCPRLGKVLSVGRVNGGMLAIAQVPIPEQRLGRMKHGVVAASRGGFGIAPPRSSVSAA